MKKCKAQSIFTAIHINQPAIMFRHSPRFFPTMKTSTNPRRLFRSKEGPRSKHLSSPISTRGLTGMAGGAFFAAMLLAWSRPVGLSDNLFGAASSDLAQCLLPARAWLFHTLRSGQGFASWNPWWMGGLPVVETARTAAFYPPVWLHAILPPVLAANLLVLAHLWGAAIAMWWFLRAVGASGSAACVGGLVYGFSGFALSRAGAAPDNALFAMPWMPLLAGAVSRVATDPAAGLWPPVARGGACLALILVCGSPPMALMCILITAAIVLICSFGDAALRTTAEQEPALGPGGHPSRRGFAPRRICAATFLIVLLGAMLSSAQWLPVVAYFPHATGPLALPDRAFVLSRTIPAYYLTALALPRLFPVMAEEVAGSSWQSAAALGVMALGLAVTAAASLLRRGRPRPSHFPPPTTSDARHASDPVSQSARGDRGSRDGDSARTGIPRRIILFSAVVLIVSLAITLGNTTALYRLPGRVVPLWLFPAPRDFFFCVCFSAAVLAGSGCQIIQLSSPERLRKRGRSFLFAAAAIAMLYVLAFYPGRHDGDHWKTWTNQLLSRAEKTSPGFHRPTDETGPAALRKDLFGQARHDIWKAIALLAATALLLRIAASAPAFRPWLGPVLALLVAADLLDYGMPLMLRTTVENARHPRRLEEEMRRLQGTQWRFVIARNEGNQDLALFHRGIRAAWIREPMAPADLARLWNLDQDGDPDSPLSHPAMTKVTPFLNRWSVRWALFPQDGKGAPRGWIEHAAIGGRVLYENTQALPRARFTSQAAVVSSPEEALLKIDDQGNSAPPVIYLSASDLALARSFPAGRSAPTVPLREWQTVDILEDAPTRIALRGDFPCSGYVVLADTALPGWRARVDGVEAPVLRADGVMRAIPVRSGSHRIEMIYVGTRAARGRMDKPDDRLRFYSSCPCPTAL